MSITRFISANKEMKTRIIFQAPNNAQTRILVGLRYVAPRTMQRKQEEGRVRIMGDRAANALSDVVESSQEYQKFVYELLASCVLRIDDGPDDPGLSIVKLAEMLPVDMAAVNEMGGIESKIHSDTEDMTPMDREERERLGYPPSVTTCGAAALHNIAGLMQYEPFQDFVFRGCRDASIFQADSIQEELKNSSARKAKMGS
jgi:hypothetical protein